MNYDWIKKPIILMIIFCMIGTCFFPNIYSKEIIKNREIHSSFSDPPVYPSTPDWISSDTGVSTGAALADFNKDGWLDLVVADGNDIYMEHVKVYYNDGDGSLPSTADWQSDDIGYNGHLDVADVNGDGWPDVAVSYLGAGDSIGPIARVYLNNNGILSSLPDWTSDVNGNAFGVDFGDVNNDGRPDLAVATGWSYSPQNFYHNYVYINVDGTLESSASWVSDDNNHYFGALWLDADYDGWMDLAYISAFQETQIYRNLGGTLETTASWHTTDSSSQDGIMLTAGDVTQDGIRDLFATDNTQLGGSGRFKQYTGLESGFFETTYSWNYYGGYGSAVALADVNGDSKLDLATGAWWSNTHIFINEGSALPTSPTWTSGVTSVIEEIVFGNVGPTLSERISTEYFYPEGDQNLFYLSRQPIQYIQSVYSDDELLSPSEYAYSREHGWISVGPTPSESLKVIYIYSPSYDMAISNWDSGIGNYLYYNQLVFADLYCDGELVWNNVNPGEIVEGSFIVENIGDPESELDWEIDSFPEWGVWLFNPSQGEDLTPEDGPITINVEVTTPTKGDIEYVGEVKVVNKNDPDDYYIIPVSLNIKGPDLDCAGNLIWNDVKPGENIEGHFIVKNKGPDGSLLDWRINSSPEWGIWTFSPESGNDLRPEDGSITINVEVVAPNENNKDFSGKVIVINTENPTDFCEINVILNTPKNRELKINLLIPQLLRNFPELLTIFNRFIHFFRI